MGRYCPRHRGYKFSDRLKNAWRAEVGVKPQKQCHSTLYHDGKCSTMCSVSRDTIFVIRDLSICLFVRRPPANMPNLHLFRREPSTVGVLQRPTKNRSHFIIMVAIATDQNLKVCKEEEFGAHARRRTPARCAFKHENNCGSREDFFRTSAQDARLN